MQYADPKKFDVDPIVDILLTDEVRRGDRIYPGWYACSLGRYRANPRDVARMRSALSRIPRVNPLDYDILFNAETREWVICKWAADSIPWGVLGEHFISQTVRYLHEIYSIDARKRSPATLGDRDWTHLKAHCKTLTGKGGRDFVTEMSEHQKKQQAAVNARRADADLDFLEYNHGRIKRAREELGITDSVTPEMMAARFGGRVEDWDPDYAPGQES